MFDSETLKRIIRLAQCPTLPCPGATTLFWCAANYAWADIHDPPNAANIVEAMMRFDNHRAIRLQLIRAL